MLDEMILKNCRRRPSNLKDDHEAEALNWDVIPILKMGMDSSIF